MKTAKDYIREIKTIEPNIRHLLDIGKINGSLLIDIEKAMQEYATEAIEADRSRLANDPNWYFEPDDRKRIVNRPIELK